MLDTLLTPMSSSVTRTTEDEVTGSQFFIKFLNQLEGWKTKCKNLHWAAPKKNIHVYLDDFLEVISDYQDSLAEDYQGITNHLMPNILKGINSDALNAIDFIKEVRDKTYEFYKNIPDEICYVGIKSETETFIHNIYKFKYLFELCDIRQY